MTRSAITAAELQAEARAQLGLHADPRVVSVLAEGVMAVEHDVAEWEASAGHMRSHRVRIGLHAALLGLVRAHPHVEDAVTRAVGVVMSTRPTESVSEVSFHFDPNAAPLASTPYRGVWAVAPASEDGERDASANDWAALASDYLTACDDAGIAAIAGRASIDVATRRAGGTEHHDVRVTLAPEDAETPRVRLAILEACLRDLVAGERGASVRVGIG
jgi:hypothetical protein